MRNVLPRRRNGGLSVIPISQIESPPLCSAEIFFFSFGARALNGPGPPHYRGFAITFRHATLGRTALYKWSIRRRDLSTWRNTSMPSAGFEPTMSASERPQSHALDIAATDIGLDCSFLYEILYMWFCFTCINNSQLVINMWPSVSISGHFINDG